MRIIRLHTDSNTFTLRNISRSIKLQQVGRRGLKGEQGDTGEGVPTGGNANQVLAKIDGADYNTAWVDQTGGGGAVDSVNSKVGVVVLDKTDVGLSNVTNDAQLKSADLDIDGTLASNSDTKISSQKATKTYVDNALLAVPEIVEGNGIDIQDIGGGAKSVALDSVKEASLLNRTNHTGVQAQSTVTNLVSDLALKAPLASPTFTGTVTTPTLSVNSIAGVGNGLNMDAVFGYYSISMKGGSGNKEFVFATSVMSQILSGLAKPTIYLGDGITAVPDVNIYRDSADVLKTDDSFVAGGTITGSNLSGNNSGDQDLSGKQDVLVSGTSIKTINGTALLGSGDITITGGGGSGTVNNFNDSRTSQANLTGSSLPALIGVVDGSNTAFTVNDGKYVAGSLSVFKNGVLQPLGDAITETTPASGIFTFTTAPTSGDQIIAKYTTQTSSSTTLINSVVAGTNVTVNNTDPLNPIVSATGGGGSPDELWVSPNMFASQSGFAPSLNALGNPYIIYVQITTGNHRRAGIPNPPIGWNTFDVVAYWSTPTTDTGTILFNIDYTQLAVGSGSTNSTTGVTLNASGVANTLNQDTIATGIPAYADMGMYMMRYQAGSTYPDKVYLLALKYVKAS